MQLFLFIQLLKEKIMMKQNETKNCGQEEKILCTNSDTTDSAPISCDGFSLSSDSIYVLNLMPDAIAIVNEKNEIIWCNEKFKLWFPNSCDPEKFGREVLAVIGHPIFLSDTNLENAVVNPLQLYSVTKKTTRGAMELSDGRYVEVVVQPWKDPNRTMFLVHEATERRELKERLRNIHSVCESLSHADELCEMTKEERRKFLVEGIQYMAKSLLHYEVMEVRTFNSKTKELELFAHYGILNEAVNRRIVPDVVGNGTIGYVAATQRSYLCSDTQNDPHYLRGGNGMRSSLTVPILFQGELMGILSAESSQLNAFDEMDRLYTEIFVHEIALAMNVLHSFEMGTTTGQLMSVEEIHGKVALPMKNILNYCLELYAQLDDTQIEAQHKLYQILRAARNVSHVIRVVGQQLPLNNVTPSREELVRIWKPVFAGKRILLIDTSLELFESGVKFFDQLDCDLDVAETGEIAFQKINLAIKSGLSYYAILSSLNGISDYPHVTQFVLDFWKIYGKAQPPLVFLMEEMSYDGEHTIANARTRYPDTGRTRKPFIESLLVAEIQKTVEQTKLSPARIIPIRGEYQDGLLEKYGPDPVEPDKF